MTLSESGSCGFGSSQKTSLDAPCSRLNRPKASAPTSARVITVLTHRSTPSQMGRSLETACGICAIIPLTRLFRLEYASLFDAINPGLARLALPIALGGTSNHFRIEALHRVNGWDAWNVTEDIDLGIRLARFSYRTAMLDSSTFEEAPVGLRAWLGQRRRWQKGWMVTLQTHSRDPARLFAELGPAGGIAIFAMLCGTVATSLLGPFFAVGVLVDAAVGPLFVPRTPTEVAWSGLAALLTSLGALSVGWPILLGMRRRGALAAAAWLALMPAYLLLLSLASWQAVLELLGQPYAWTKTEHGLARHRDRAASTGIVPHS